jgi:hypothetical protein
MNDQLQQLTVLAALVSGAALAYARLLGNAQMYIVQAAIDALSLPSKLRPAVNIALGLFLAILFSLLLAWYAADLRLLAVGVLAGILASVSAAQAHDAASEGEGQATPPEPP